MNNIMGYIINEAVTPMEEIEFIANGSDRITGKGRLQTGNETNRNGRIYRTEDLAREISALMLLSSRDWRKVSALSTALA